MDTKLIAKHHQSALIVLLRRASELRQEADDIEQAAKEMLAAVVGIDLNDNWTLDLNSGAITHTDSDGCGGTDSPGCEGAAGGLLDAQGEHPPAQ